MQGSFVRATLEGRKTQTRRPVQPWLGRNPPLWSRLIDQDGKPDFDWGELLYYGQDGPSKKWITEIVASKVTVDAREREPQVERDDAPPLAEDDIPF